MEQLHVKVGIGASVKKYVMFIKENVISYLFGIVIGVTIVVLLSSMFISTSYYIRIIYSLIVGIIGNAIILWQIAIYKGRGYKQFSKRNIAILLCITFVVFIITQIIQFAFAFAPSNLRGIQQLVGSLINVFTLLAIYKYSGIDNNDISWSKNMTFFVLKFSIAYYFAELVLILLYAVFISSLVQTEERTKLLPIVGVLAKTLLLPIGFIYFETKKEEEIKLGIDSSK